MKSYGNSVIIILSIILFFVIALSAHTIYNPDKFELDRDGACLYKSILPPDTIERWRELCGRNKYLQLKMEMRECPRIRALINTVSPEYTLQDYIWIIERSSVHTCHRDNNGTFFNKNQRHKSYTMLVYLEDMDKCLGVIPRSHVSPDAYNWNMVDRVVDIAGCNAGDVIVFDANLIHVGTILDKDDHLRVQLKLTHPDDLAELSYYQDFNKVLNKPNTNPHFVRRIQRRLSCMIPAISNLTQQDNIKSARGTDGGATISVGQRIFSYLFYGDSSFYDLPDATKVGYDQGRI